MTGLTSVSVTLATYKAIEAQRLSFSENHDAIIRRALAERDVRRRHAPQRVSHSTRGTSRKHGRTSVVIFDRTQSVFNLRDAYLVILAALVRHKASLFQLLLAEGTPRRRWIAATPGALFVTSPHLAHEHAHEIAPGWFVDTNLSRAQIIARLTTAARLADCSYGTDVKIVEG